MTHEKSNAERLAEQCDTEWPEDCDILAIAAELRRIPELERQRGELLDALKKARAELDGLPRSLGYDFTHLPEIDAAIAAAKESTNG